MPNLPSKGELVQLPLRAVVAYAARCACRVLPLYRLADDHPNLRKHVASLERAVLIAEHFAAGTEIMVLSDNERETAGNQFRGVVLVARHAAYEANDARLAAIGNAAAAAGAICAAAGTLVDASESEAAANALDGDAFAAAAAMAAADAVAAARAAVRAASDAGTKITSAMRSDYDRLAQLDFRKANDLGKLIDATENGPLGPLWPDGPPDWYVEGLEWQRKILDERDPELAKQIEESNPAPLISVCFDDSDFTQEEMLLFLKYVSETYRGMGGIGLKIVRGHSFVPETEEVAQ